MGNIKMGLNRFAVMYVDAAFFKLYDVNSMDNYLLWDVLQDKSPSKCPLIKDIWQHQVEKPSVYFIDSALNFDDLLAHFESDPMGMHQTVLENGRKMI